MIGDGTGNTPIGIINSGATNAGGGAVLTWAEVLNFIALVEVANALQGSLGWAMHPEIKKILRSTLVAGSTDSRMIMTDPNSLAGYPVASSTALPGASTGASGCVIFGAWQDLLIGSWSGVDLLLNPFDSVGYLKGRVLLRALKDVDVQVRHAESFAFQNDVTI